MDDFWKHQEDFSQIEPKLGGRGRPREEDEDPYPEENDALDALVDEDRFQSERNELDMINNSNAFEIEYSEILQSILELLRNEWRARRPPPPAQIPASLPVPYSRAQRLLQTGATIVLDEWFTRNVARLVAQFDQTLLEFPEYRRDLPQNANPLYVLGGFAALGNASSWHNPFVRFLRLHAMRAVYPLFADVTRQRGEYLAQMADRMLFRPAGVKPMADTWHRDIKKDSPPGDTIYGGWINTSDQDQALSCVLNTQNDPADPRDPQGFEKITDPARIVLYERSKSLIVVPPGGILVFNERMVHEVLAVKKNYPIRRVFLAWLTTLDNNKKFPANIDTLLTRQAVIKLKSDQMPRMYPKSYITYYVDKLTEWSVTTLKPAMLIPKVQPATAKKLPGQTIQIARAEARSLAEDGFPLYPAYEQHERDLFVARRSHTLPTFVGSDRLAVMSLNQ
jgi:hypothetical protein